MGQTTTFTNKGMKKKQKKTKYAYDCDFTVRWVFLARGGAAGGAGYVGGRFPLLFSGGL